MDTGEKIRVERVQLSERQSFCSGGYCLCLLSEGGRVRGKSREVRCNAGDAVLAAPGSYTFLMDSRQEGVLIRFDREVPGESWIPVLQECPLLLQFFFQAGEGNAENFLVFEGAGKELEELLRLLMDTYGEKGPYYQSVLACELMSLLLTLCSRCRAHTVLTWEPGRELYEQIVRYVTQSCAKATLTNVAEHFHYHPNTIARVVRLQAGCSFQELRGNIRLSRAAWLILQHNESIEDIAHACGYKNMSNFYAQFRKKYGVNPGEYPGLSAQGAEDCAGDGNG